MGRDSIELFHRIVVWVGKKDLLPVVLTSLSFFISVLLYYQADIQLVLQFFVICSLQIFISKYNKIYSSVVPLEIKSKKSDRKVTKWGKQACLLGCIVPIVYLLSPAVSWAVVGLISCIYSITIRDVLLRGIRRKHSSQEVRNYLKSQRPEIAVYVTGLAEVAYQINQWIPVLAKLNKEVVIIIRESRAYDGIVKTSMPVVFARTQLELEVLLGPGTSIEKVLYPANTMKNVQALRYYKLKHFFINHGESDKAVNQSKMLMAYDYLLVAGPLSESRLRDAGLPLRERQVIHVGRPQTEMLLDVVREKSQIKTLLYAPTWEGHVKNVDYSSVDKFGYELCKEILETKRYKVVFKPHPYTGENNRNKSKYLKKLIKLFEENRDSGGEIYDGSKTIYELMNDSDALICDVSSVLNDYLSTGKPIFLCNPMGLETERLELEFPSSRSAYILSSSRDVVSTIESVDSFDEKGSLREEVRNESLGSFEKGSFEKFSSAIELE